MTKEEIDSTERMLYREDVNPHLVFADIKHHGYLIATMNKLQMRVAYYFTDNILDRKAKEYKAASYTIDAMTFAITKE